MASATTKFSLTKAWQSISGENLFLHIQVRATGDAEIYYGASEPAASAEGEVLNSSDRDGMAIALGADDGVWARTQNPGGLDIIVMARAT